MDECGRIERERDVARSVVEEQRKILAKERERREVVEREMASVREELEGWKEGCEQYEGCYRYWEKVAKDRAPDPRLLRFLLCGSNVISQNRPWTTRNA